MGKIQSHDHYANQKGWSQPMSKPSASTTKHVGVTPPISKPSPSTSNNVGVTPPHPTAKHSTKGSRKTETMVSPDTDTSNGGM